MNKSQYLVFVSVFMVVAEELIRQQALPPEWLAILIAVKLGVAAYLNPPKSPPAE